MRLAYLREHGREALKAADIIADSELRVRQESTPLIPAAQCSIRPSPPGRGLLLALVLLSGCRDDLPTVSSRPAAQPGEPLLSLDSPLCRLGS